MAKTVAVHHASHWAGLLKACHSAGRRVRPAEPTVLVAGATLVEDGETAGPPMSATTVLTVTVWPSFHLDF